MATLVPHLWFNGTAGEAAAFYAQLFPDSEILSTTVLHNTPEGDALTVRFRAWGQEFQAIDGGDFFHLNPSISFIVNVDPSRVPDAAAEVDRLWTGLTEGGQVLMELGEYPFSARYGWVADRFGVSWQVMLTNPEGEPRAPIVPNLSFGTNARTGAQEAREAYLEIFPDAQAGSLYRFEDMVMPEGAPDVPPQQLAYSDLKIAGTWVAMMDAPGFPDVFSEGLSLILLCEDQAEMDLYWDALTAVPESEQCGWLKDRFGVSWQITPAEMGRMMSEGTPEQIQRVVDTFMPMKKLDAAALRAAYEG